MRVVVIPVTQLCGSNDQRDEQAKGGSEYD
jgi:hypothetical protein